MDSEYRAHKDNSHNREDHQRPALLSPLNGLFLRFPCQLLRGLQYLIRLLCPNNCLLRLLDTRTSFFYIRVLLL